MWLAKVAIFFWHAWRRVVDIRVIGVVIVAMAIIVVVVVTLHLVVIMITMHNLICSAFAKIFSRFRIVVVGVHIVVILITRSEERRVGKECRL